jgi:hypothetical protein
MRLTNTLNPVFTATVSGLVLADTPIGFTGVVSSGTAIAGLGTLSVTSTAQAESAIGTYAITPTGLSSSNYTITPVNGTLSIVAFIGGSADPSYNAVGSVAQSALVGGYTGGAEVGPFAVHRSRRSGAASGDSAAPVNYGDWVSLTIRNGGVRLPGGVI